MAPVALLVVAVVGLVLWRTAVYKSDLDKGLIALNNAYAQERPIEARISMLDYAPFVAARGNEPEQTNTLELDRAQRLLLDAEKENPGGASHHALGKLYLLQKQPDKAIGYLENAIKADPKNAQIYADLGAAYLEKGKLELETSKPDLGSANAGKGLGDLGRSLEFLQQALELNPNLLEALFNRALVHQHQDLYQEAQANWRAYLEKDASSQWAVEARQNLKLLEEKTRTCCKTTCGRRRHYEPRKMFCATIRAGSRRTTGPHSRCRANTRTHSGFRHPPALREQSKTPSASLCYCCC
jgi:tetratricopeptide (TPR) repeat protein